MHLIVKYRIKYQDFAFFIVFELKIATINLKNK